MYNIAKIHSPQSVSETAAEVVRKYWRLVNLHGQFLETNVNEVFDRASKTVIYLFLAVPFLTAGILALIAGIGTQVFASYSFSTMLGHENLLYVLYGAAAVLLLASMLLLFYVRDNLSRIGLNVKETFVDIRKDFETVNDIV